MKKRLLSFLLALLFILPTATLSFAEGTVPTSLEAPTNVNARVEEGTIMLRWTVPQSILDYAKESFGEMLFAIDYKINNGPWQYGGSISEEILSSYDDQFKGYVEGMKTDVGNVQETFFVYFHFGIADEDKESFELMDDTYTFRMRFAFHDYENEGENYLTSPYSNETTVGGKTQVTAPTSLDAPTNLKVEVKKNTDGSPYFYLNWVNAAKVDNINKNFPIEVKVDFKVGNDKWYSEKEGHDWWGGNFYTNNVEFDPVKLDIADKIVIEENTYYFRILYAYEPTYGNHVYSQFSNIVSIGVQKFESASPWAKPELQKADDLGLIPDILNGKDLTKPITREEFAELALLLYEKMTGNTSDPAPSDTFKDTKNPQILKAYKLGITSGTSPKGVTPATFTPNQLITREQCAAMLFRTIKLIIPNGDFSVAGVEDFADQKLIFPNFVESTKYMKKIGIVLPDAKGNFNPKASTPADEAANIGMALRQQAIAMSVRTYEKLK